MSTEIRPIRSDEATNYLHVLPYANGLPNWEPEPAAWHAGPEASPPPNSPATPEQLQAWGEEVLAEPFHTMAAFVDGRLVGGSGMVSLEITAPGGRPVSLGGVTATGVIATHRRRGLLRSMMQKMFDAALERGELLAGLSASEGAIYGRYGFSPATWRSRWEIQRSQAQLIEPTSGTSGSLDLVGAETARSAWPSLWNSYRLDHVGELSGMPDLWAGLNDEAEGTSGPTRYLVHRNEAAVIDGIANFRLPWAARAEDAGTLVVDAICALTTTAERALWGLLLDFDLTKTIAAAARPNDEPLRWMLQNPRALRITRLSDNLWLRLLDLPRALEARNYHSDDTLTIRVETDEMCPRNNGTWEIKVRNGIAECLPTTATPDLLLAPQALGSLYLGGLSAANLARGHRAEALTPGSLIRLGRLFRTDPEPHNSFGF